MPVNIKTIVPAAVAVEKAVSGKPLHAANGSIAHFLTNDKLDSVTKVLKEVKKEKVKHVLKVGGITAGAGAAASLAVGNSTRAASLFAKTKDDISNTLSKISVNGKTVKDIIKNTKVFQKFNSLPAPAKAGIAVAAAAFAAVAPLADLNFAFKAGYIGGKHESQKYYEYAVSNSKAD